MSKKVNLQNFQDGHWSCNAYLSYRDLGWHILANGYFDAANVLVGATLNPNFINKEYANYRNDDTGELLFHSSKDSAVYPIIFLYRHYIEVSLKNAIYTIKKLQFEDIKQLNEHSIQTYFQTFKSAYIHLHKSEMYEMSKDPNFKELLKELKRIENIIITIGELDDSSFTFRYLTDKEGEYIFSNNEMINIENIADKVQDVKTFFEHLKCGFDMLEEVRQIYLKDIGQVY